MAVTTNNGWMYAVNEIDAKATAGTLIKKAVNVPAAAVPFADLTAAANAFNAMRTALINAGLMAAS